MKKQLLEWVNRVCIYLLIAVMLVGMLPVMTMKADALTASEINTQIESTYKAALAKAGVSSFNGWCGLFVNWELVILGINSSYVGADGKDEYNTYERMGTTSGGYRIASYPASTHSLSNALNTITNNGTKDATNILVGFETGSGSDGALYGHVVFIHAIIDGTVYFSESFGNAKVGGKSYPEGSAIACSISTFASYYNSWTTLDGVIHFKKDVSEYISTTCTLYPCAGTLEISENCNPCTLPCNSETASKYGYTSEALTNKRLYAGDTVTATALYKNSEGNYWYQVTLSDGTAAYVWSEKCFLDEPTFPWVKNGYFPESITGSTYLNGVVTTGGSQIDKVYAVVYKGNSTSGTAALKSKVVSVGATSYNLYASDVDYSLTFQSLTNGYYTLAIFADFTCYYIDEGKLTTTGACDALAGSYYFKFGSGTTPSTYTITFNANGGTCSESTRSIEQGKAIGTLPTPTRSGCTFNGWYTAASGGTKVTSNTVFSSNTTLYAQWSFADAINLGSDFYAYIKHPASGYSLSNVDRNVELGTYGETYSLWYFTRNSDNSYTIKSVYDDNVIDVYNNDTANGTNIWTHPSNNTSAQKWYLKQVGSGYSLISANSLKALDIANGDTAIGTNAQLYTANGSAAQIFEIEIVDPNENTCDHSYVYKLILAPTTETTGIMRHECKYCGKYTDFTLPVLNDNYYVYYVAEESTCTETGRAIYQLNMDTGDIFQFHEVLPAKGHSYVGQYMEASCDHYGYTTYTCSGCGDSYVVYDEQGWSDWSEAYPENADQVESRTEYRYQDKEMTTSTSSTLDGWTLYKTTTQWSDYGSWSSWSDSAVTASDATKVETRTVYGYYYYLCSKCGAHMHGYGTCYTWAGGCGASTKSEDFRSVWHTTSWDNANLKDWHGTGKYYTYLDGQLVFKWTDGGSKTQYRSCNREIVTTYYYYRWGNWSDWSTTAYSANDSRNVETRTVFRYLNELPGHAYSYWVSKSPTEDTTGELTGICLECGEKTFLTLPKLNVTDYTYRVIKTASCTSTGTARYTWNTTQYGNFYFEITLPQSTHNYVGTVKYPTCTQKGYTAYTCSGCGDSYVADYVSAHGHSVVLQERLPATCSEDGYELYYCEHCGNEEYTVILAAAGHHYQDGICNDCGMAEPVGSPNTLIGDLNLDGNVDSDDLTLLARHVGGIEAVEGQALLNADVNGDGVVNSDDLTKHARYVGGIITSWDQE